MNRYDTKQRFSIRKFKVGVGSVLLSTLFMMGSSSVSADELASNVNQPETVVVTSTVNDDLTNVENSLTDEIDQPSDVDDSLNSNELPTLTTDTIESTDMVESAEVMMSNSQLDDALSKLTFKFDDAHLNNVIEKSEDGVDSAELTIRLEGIDKVLENTYVEFELEFKPTDEMISRNAGFNLLTSRYKDKIFDVASLNHQNLEIFETSDHSLKGRYQIGRIHSGQSIQLPTVVNDIGDKYLLFENERLDYTVKATLKNENNDVLGHTSYDAKVIPDRINDLGIRLEVRDIYSDDSNPETVNDHYVAVRRTENGQVFSRSTFYAILSNSSERHLTERLVAKYEMTTKSGEDLSKYISYQPNLNHYNSKFLDGVNGEDEIIITGKLYYLDQFQNLHLVSEDHTIRDSIKITSTTHENDIRPITEGRIYANNHIKFEPKFDTSSFIVTEDDYHGNAHSNLLYKISAKEGQDLYLNTSTKFKHAIDRHSLEEIGVSEFVVEIPRSKNGEKIDGKLEMFNVSFLSEFKTYKINLKSNDGQILTFDSNDKLIEVAQNLNMSDYESISVVLDEELIAKSTSYVELVNVSALYSIKNVTASKYDVDDDASDSRTTNRAHIVENTDKLLNAYYYFSGVSNQVSNFGSNLAALDFERQPYKITHDVVPNLKVSKNVLYKTGDTRINATISIENKQRLTENIDLSDLDYYLTIPNTLKPSYTAQSNMTYVKSEGDFDVYKLNIYDNQYSSSVSSNDRGLGLIAMSGYKSELPVTFTVVSKSEQINVIDSLNTDEFDVNNNQITGDESSIEFVENVGKAFDVKDTGSILVGRSIFVHDEIVSPIKNDKVPGYDLQLLPITIGEIDQPTEITIISNIGNSMISPHGDIEVSVKIPHKNDLNSIGSETRGSQSTAIFKSVEIPDGWLAYYSTTLEDDIRNITDWKLDDGSFNMSDVKAFKLVAPADYILNEGERLRIPYKVTVNERLTFDEALNVDLINERFLNKETLELGIPLVSTTYFKSNLQEIDGYRAKALFYVDIDSKSPRNELNKLLSSFAIPVVRHIDNVSETSLVEGLDKVIRTVNFREFEEVSDILIDKEYSTNPYALDPYSSMSSLIRFSPNSEFTGFASNMMGIYDDEELANSIDDYLTKNAPYFKYYVDDNGHLRAKFFAKPGTLTDDERTPENSFNHYFKNIESNEPPVITLPLNSSDNTETKDVRYTFVSKDGVERATINELSKLTDIHTEYLNVLTYRWELKPIEVNESTSGSVKVKFITNDVVPIVLDEKTLLDNVITSTTTVKDIPIFDDSGQPTHVESTVNTVDVVTQYNTESLKKNEFIQNGFKYRLIGLHQDSPQEQGNVQTGETTIVYVYEKLEPTFTENTESKQITRTIKYVNESGEEVASNKVDVVTYKRISRTNDITNEVTYSDWSSSKSTFDEVLSPVIENRSTETAVVNQYQTSHDTENFEVIVRYNPTTSTIRETKEITRTIKYVDESNNQVATPDVQRVEISREVTINDVTKARITEGQWSSDKFTNIVSPTIENRETDTKVVEESVVTETTNDFEVVVRYVPTFTTDVETESVTRTITYVDELDRKVSEDVVETLTFTRSVITNNVTKEVEYGEWSTNDNEFDSVVSPLILNRETDTKVVDSRRVDATFEDTVIKVVYQPTFNESQETRQVTRTIKYVNELNESVSNDVVDTVTFVRTNRINNVTNAVEFGAWSTEDSSLLKSVISPVIENRSTDTLVVNSREVNPDTQSFEVIVRYNPTFTDGLEIETVTRTINYVDDKGLKLRDSVVETLTFTRTTRTNNVTNDVEFGEWTTNDNEFDRVISPIIENRKTDTTEVSNLVVESNTQDIEINVVYVPTFTEGVESKEVTRTIIYVNELDQEVADKKVEKLTFIRTTKTNDVTKDVEFSEWSSTDNDFDTVISPIIENRTTSTTLVNSEIVDETYGDQEIVIRYVPTSTKGVETKDVTRTIKYVDEAGKELKDSLTETITFTRNISTNDVTKEVTYLTNWTSTKSSFDEVISPEFDNRETDKKIVSADEVTHDSENKVVVVEYRLTFTVSTESKDITRVIKYVDENDHEIKDRVIDTVTFTREVTTNNVTKQSEFSEWTSTDKTFDEVISPNVDNRETEIKVVNSEEVTYDSENKEVIVRYVPTFTSNVEIESVTRTIKYVDENGQKVSDDVVEILTFTRKTETNDVTNEIKYGEWETNNDTFINVTSPDIENREADIKEVGVIKVDSQSNDIEVIVAYRPTFTNANEIKEITRVIKYLDESNNPVSTQVEDKVVFTRDVTINDVTKEATYTDWKTTNNVFDRIISPDIANRVADQKVVEEVVVNENSDSIEVIVRYVPTFTSQEESKQVTRIIKYVDENGIEIKDRVVETLTFTRKSITNDVTKKVTYTDWSSDKNSYDDVTSPVIDNRQTDTKVVSSEIVNHDSSDKEVIVKYVPTSTVNEELKVIKRTIRFVDETGTELKDSVIETKTFTRQSTTNNVTNEVTYTKWTSNDSTFKELITPDIENRTTVTKVISSETITPFTEDTVIDVVYTPILNKSIETTNVARTIKYVDEFGNELKDSEVEIVTFKREVVTNQVTNEVTYTEWTSDNDKFNDVESPELSNLVTETKLVTGRQVSSTDTDEVIVVTYRPTISIRKEFKDITRTIKYVDENHNEIYERVVDVVRFERDIEINDFDKSEKVSNWNLTSHTFERVISPVIKDFKTDTLISNEFTVLPSDNDIEEIIVYKQLEKPVIIEEWVEDPKPEEPPVISEWVDEPKPEEPPVISEWVDDPKPEEPPMISVQVDEPKVEENQTIVTENESLIKTKETSQIQYIDKQLPKTGENSTLTSIIGAIMTSLGLILIKKKKDE